ncbi:MAG: GNAT family N-acetyltransferase [Bacteroidota bacterium]
MYHTFIEAFEDYAGNMKMDRQAFERRMLDKLQIDWNLSAGAFSGDKMVGFITQTLNQYNGKRTVYNGGTGVIPAYRGHDLTGHMYRALLPEMIKHNADQVILEAIVDNQWAIDAYEKVGFERNRRLKCFKRVKEADKSISDDFTDLKVVDFDSSIVQSYSEDLSTSFMDTLDQLYKGRTSQKMILSVDDKGQLIGYLVFDPSNARVARAWVSVGKRRQGIGRKLVNYAAQLSDNKPLSILNIDDQATVAHQFLIACGFENQIHQWEMTLEIK